MPDFGDFIVYVDESGDHSLTSIDPAYPVFVLAFCIFNKASYASQVVPALQAFKFKWFGEDTVVLHEHEIRRKAGPFSFLQNTARREAFMTELTEILAAAEMKVIPVVIRKERLKEKYSGNADNPYHLSLVFCMERLRDYLEKNGQSGRTTHIIFEQRGGKEGGGKEDKELEREFFRIKAGDHYLCSQTFADLELRIVSKQINSAGLQIADLIARPIGVSCLRPDQNNRAVEVIADKLLKRGEGYRDHGVKLFP